MTKQIYCPCSNLLHPPRLIDLVKELMARLGNQEEWVATCEDCGTQVSFPMAKQVSFPKVSSGQNHT